MTALILPNRQEVWTQPQHHVKLIDNLPIDVKSYRIWSQPAEADAEAGFYSNEPFTRVGAITRKIGQTGGIGHAGDGTTNKYHWRDTLIVPQAAWIGTQFTTQTLNPGTRHIYGMGSSAVSSGALLAIFNGNGGNLKITSIFRTTDGASSISIVGPLSNASINTWSVIAVFPTDQCADAYLYVNGIKYTTNTGNNGTFSSSNNLVYESISVSKRGALANGADEIVHWTAYGLGQIPELLARQLSENPYSIVQPPRRRLFGVASSDVSVSLTGIGITSSSGTLAPSMSVSASGTAITTSIGSLLPLVSSILSGNVINTGLGTLAVALDTTATGISLSFSLGTLTATVGGDVAVSLTGVSMTAAVGSLVASIQTALTGQAITCSDGVLTPALLLNALGSSITTQTGNVSVAVTAGLSGVSVVSGLGLLVPAIAKALTGEQIATSTGTLTYTLANGDVTVNLTGESISILQGVLTPAIAKTLTSDAISFQLGAIIPGILANIEGLQTAIEQGVMSVSINITLNGNAVTLVLGNLSTGVNADSITWIILEQKSNKLIACSSSNKIISTSRSNNIIATSDNNIIISGS